MILAVGVVCGDEGAAAVYLAVLVLALTALGVIIPLLFSVLVQFLPETLAASVGQSLLLFQFQLLQFQLQVQVLLCHLPI